MARAPLLTLSGIGHAIGSQTLFSGLDLAIGEGERLCLVGRNGAGKSTLLRILAGELAPEAGERSLRPGTRVALLAQEPDFAGHERLDAWIAGGLPADRAEDRHLVAAALDESGLDGAADPATLSGGELRRAALARAFLGEPGLLLLDEPTNHLDLPAIEALERRLAAFPGAAVTISHDRAFLRGVARGCLWLDRGRVRRLDRGLDAFDDWAEAELAREAAETAKLDKRIREETRWSRQGITARRKRNQGRLRRLEEMRAERRRRIAPQGTAALAAGTAKASGKSVIEAEGISKRFGERVVLRNFSTRIQRGDRVGIVGPNGAGKTTLLGLLTGTTAPDSGTVRLGTGLEMLRIEQSRASLDPDSTPWQVLTGGGGDQVMVRGRPKHVVAYLEDFLFSPDQARTPVRALSGGERNRLLLARELAKPANLLVLDEPTNDLDLETLDLLEEVLADHPGTVLLVSHDRDFLDRLVSSTILLDGRGGATEFAGVPESWHAAAVAVPASPQRPVRKKAPAAPPPPLDTRRMSHAERRELAETEARIEAAGREIALLERALADPDAWSREPQKCRLAASRLAACRQRLAAAEERWLELEGRREESGG